MKLFIVTCSNRKATLDPSFFSLPFKELEIYFVKQNLAATLYTHTPHVHEYVQKAKGVSKARNFALRMILPKAKATDIILFTDDDCIVSADWIKQIQQFFFAHPKADAVFGQTCSYQPQQHPKEICPCTITKTEQHRAVVGDKHWENIGFSNNMAVKAQTFNQLGLFKEWLGPGSIGSNGEDSEWIIRALLHHYKVYYEPSIKIYHNKWLDQAQQKKQNLSYTIGGIASYGFYAFLGQTAYQPILKINIRSSTDKIWENIYQLKKMKKNNQTIKNALTLIADSALETLALLRGLAVAFIFAETTKTKIFFCQKKNQQSQTLVRKK